MDEFNTQFNLNEAMKKAGTPTLTLHPEQEKRAPVFPEETPVPEEASPSETCSAGAIDESMLTDEEKAQVEAFSRQINLKDIRQVNSFGASAQKSIAGFSSSITSRVQNREFGELGDCLRNLEAAINSTTAPEKKGLLGIFQKGKQKVSYLVSNYQTAETSIRSIESDLKKHQQALTKDVYVFDQMYDLNLQYYKEITMYIIAGKKALNHARATELTELQRKAEFTQDQLDIQLYRDFEDTCVRFEKKIYDLEATRLVSIQTAPQIRLLQNANQEVVDQLRSNIMNTIPLWRNQMVLALGIEHSRRALDAQSAITEMTNEMFRRNAETLKAGAIDAAKASERAIIDVETLRKCNADIISSINEVVKIHEEGSRRRIEAQAELTKLEDDLKNALLNAGAKYEPIIPR